jgi:prophage DNA circulation protein
MWRDVIPYVQASFRGVPFQTVDAEARVGRRNVTHEYPQRDDPYAEDLGRRARQYVVEAYVLGDDYLAQRDALIDAIEQAGPGELVHPRWGTLQVVVLESVSIKESTREGGIARFSITFGEAGQNTFPKATTDTVFEIDAASALMEDMAAADFTLMFDALGSSVLALEGIAAFLRDFNDFVLMVRRVCDVLQIGDIERRISATSTNLTTLIATPAILVQNIVEICGDFTDALVRPVSALSEFEAIFYAKPRPSSALVAATVPGSTRARLLANEIAHGDLQRRLGLAGQARALALALVEPAAPTSRRLALAAQARSQEAGAPSLPISSAMRSAGSAPLTVSRLWSSGREPQIDTVRKALELRDRLLAQIDVELEQNDPPTEVAAALVRLRAAITRDVAARSEQLRRASRFTPALVLPSLAIAQRVYQDAARVDELESRNGIRHPAFVPALPLEVLQ